MKKMSFFVAVLVLFAASNVVFAASIIVGPYPNYKGTVETGVYIEVPTRGDRTFIDPFGGEHHIASRGGQVIESEETYDLPVYVRSYTKLDSSEGVPFDPAIDGLILTEIWAVDLQPELPLDDVPDSEGFNPPPFGVTMGDASFTGRSGTEYPATVSMVEVGNLETTLPDYDVSKIAGDAANVVYVAQATVPAAEFIIEEPSPYFLVDSQTQWEDKLNEEWPDVHIRGLTQEEGDAYLLQLGNPDFLVEGSEPYSPIDPDLPLFVPPTLYVYEGDDDEGSPEPDDAGLVMEWGPGQSADGQDASAWAWEYGDPDLSNCIIKVTATPWGPSGINRISLGMQDINGNIRSWWWNVPGVIPYNVPTVITIDTTKTGLSATTPPASGSSNNPAFDITKVQSIVADENANWVGSQLAVPPGGTIAAIWNYWHNLTVMPKPPGGVNSKWYVKYSQPPDVNDIAQGDINGWDEVSLYNHQPDPIMADDWKCEDDRPVTDIHWWGSFIGWTQPDLPPILPSAFHIGIWTDVPDPNVNDPLDWSHPGALVWENMCDSAVWNFAGYDVDPRIGDPNFQENETCFQWAQFLSQDKWFYQEPNEVTGTNVYWLSISAVYPAGTNFADPNFYPWGWKTRPHMFNDDAVRITQTSAGTWPPVIGSTLIMTNCAPVEWPVGVSWDLAFELTTNAPAYEDEPIEGDIAGGGTSGNEPDGSVGLPDLLAVARNWLTTAP